ncbi:Bacterial Ig-like domain (group 1) [Acinetobacter venetianus]|uniref:Bacterial Ig-like domain (Group 1) n=1 Tax=Acinetobacter venetianus TaxID=52133 RepID=A0A150HNS5_9GAMM|nr:Ig-like domain-containing protein [Acinetobacter venetianus]KXZ68213.1 Bacterial Ig-like domain (group 1) [Acinetobacter venetianus]
MNTKQLKLKLSTIAMSILLASCGGGGGYYDSNNSNDDSNSGVETPISSLNITNIELYDVNNQLTNTITIAGATAKVRIIDQSGQGVSGVLVTFSGDGITFGTTNGAVLTNADGEAIISVKPDDINATGAYQLTAVADYNGLTAEASAYNFSLQAANIALVNMMVAESDLASGGSTNITLKTQDADTKVNQNNVTVNFSTSCGTFEPSSVISSNQGDVTTSYKAIDTNGKLCAGTQKIIASSSSDASIKQEVQVNIADIVANSLIYTTTTPVNIVTKNSGSASSGKVEFTVYANGVPASNQEISIGLVKGPSDLSLSSENFIRNTVIKSDSFGKVLVSLYPGSLPGPVEIKAALKANPNIFVLSKDVAVATGRAYQSGLSLSMSKNSLRTDIDGDSATIVARLADRVGNPVPKGTVISFVSEGGKIQPNCATDEQGECQVTLITQNPRPLDDRVSVLAYTEGDKAYKDVNGDNMYTVGIDMLLNNIGDFFRDDNENNQFDEGEFVYKRNVSGAICSTSSIGQPNIVGTCDNELDAVLRQQMLVAFAHDTPTLVGLSGIDQAMYQISNNTFSFQIFGNTQKTVPMPSGTKVSVSVKDNTDNDLTCEADMLFGNDTTPNVMGLLTPSTFGLSTNDSVKYTVRLLKCDAGDDVKLTITAPGKTTVKTITLN